MNNAAFNLQKRRCASEPRLRPSAPSANSATPKSFTTLPGPSLSVSFPPIGIEAIIRADALAREQ